MKLYLSKTSRNAKNQHYPDEVNITYKNLKASLKKDHVMCKFEDNKRSKKSWLSSDCLFGDVDNAGEEKISIDEFELLFKDVEYVLATSKSHQIEKDGLSAADRFHVYFPIEETDDKELYDSYLARLVSKYKFFDKNASDIARFFFGHASDIVKLHGGKSIISKLIGVKIKKSTTNDYSIGDMRDHIHGERNTDLLKFCCSWMRNLKNDDDLEDALSTLVFVENSKSSEPVDDDELIKIVKSALRYRETADTDFGKTYVKVLLGNKPVGLAKTNTEEKLDFTNGNLAYRHLKVQIKGESCSAWTHWWDSTPLYRPVFKPGGNIKNGEWNLFHGWNTLASEEGSCDLFLEHILNNIAAGDEEHAMYIFSWFADIFQNPEEKPGICLAFRGIEGVGKTIIGYVFSKLLGDMYINILPGMIAGRFNMWLMNKLLIQGDEAVFAGDKYTKNILKGMITDPSISIEGKGRDIFTIKSYGRILFTSNDDWVVPAGGDDDRRYAIFDVIDNGQRNNREYFGAILQQLKNGGYEKLLYWLLNYENIVDLSKIPMTEARKEHLTRGMHVVEQYIISAIEKKTFSDGEEYELSQLYEGYSNWITLNNLPCKYKDEISFKQRFGKLTKKYNIEVRKLGRVLKYYFNA